MALWKLDQINWQSFQPDAIDNRLLRLAKGACLVEYNSGDYVAYLENVFRGDDEICEAIRRWGDDERLHGEALARWVQMADPQFDFDTAFNRFRSVYRIAVDAQESIRGSRAQELVARCLVETGTSTFYSSLANTSREPVFKQICKLIAADEIHHYKLFLNYLPKYERLDGLSRWNRVKTAVQRSIEVEDEELALAYACGNEMDDDISRASYKRYSRELLALTYSLYTGPQISKATKLAMNAAGLPKNRWLTGIAAAAINGAFRLRQLTLGINSSKSI